MRRNPLVIILVVLLALAVIPVWPYSTAWGYYPAGGLGTLGIILIVLLLLGVI
jgi:hypothetical protein